MTRLLLAAPLVALLVWLPKPAVAELSCPLFFEGDPNAPDAAKKAFAENAADAVTICPSAPGDRPTVTYVSSPVRGDQGVCSFSESDEFHQETYMLSGEAKCPRQGDSRYVLATGLSEGMFIALLELVRRIASSPSEFDGAVQSPEDLRRKYSDYDLIRASVTSTSGSQQFEFGSARLDTDRNQYILDYGDKPDCSHGLVYGSEAIRLYADLTSQGLRIVDMDRIHIISGLRCIETPEFDF